MPFLPINYIYVSCHKGVYVSKCNVDLLYSTSTNYRTRQTKHTQGNQVSDKGRWGGLLSDPSDKHLLHVYRYNLQIIANT